jgi:hypothetical protein
MFPQFLPLSRSRFFQDASGQPLCSGVGDFLHLRKIHVQSGAFVTKPMTNDDFPPLLGESADSLQFRRCELPRCHDIVILDVREIRLGEFRAIYPTLLPLPRKGCPALLGVTGRVHRLTRVLCG